MNPDKALPLIELNAFSLMRLLRVSYESQNPRQTLSFFLDSYCVSCDLLVKMTEWILWQKHKQMHPLDTVLLPEVKLVRDMSHAMSAEHIKNRFIFFATTLSHVYVCDETVARGSIAVHLSPEHCAPVFYKAPNTKVPYVWLCPNQFGMPQVISSYEERPFHVSLKRRERSGDMLPLELSYFNENHERVDARAHVHMCVNVHEKESFAVTRVERVSGVPDFMILLTAAPDYLYLRTVLIQSSGGSFLLYPVCVHQ